MEHVQNAYWKPKIETKEQEVVGVNAMMEQWDSFNKDGRNDLMTFLKYLYPYKHCV